MAYTDPVSSGLQSYIFGGNTGVPTDKELERRRQITVALAMRQRAYPKTVGEGLTALGEGLGDRWAQDSLLAGERAVRQQGQAAQQANPLPPTAPGPVSPPGTPAVVVPGRTDAPEAVPDAAPVAVNDAGRNAIAAATMPAAPGVPPANPTQSEGDSSPTTSQADERGSQPGNARLAALTTGVTSDAPPLGVPAGKPILAPDTEENPPTPTDIKPMPRVAQTGGAVPAAPLPGNAPVPTTGQMGLVPDPTAARVPLRFPTPIEATPPAPQYMRQPKPIAPQMQTDLTDLERKGIAIQQQAPDNAYVQQWGQKFIDLGAAQRKAAYDRQVEQYRGDLANYNQQALAEAEYARNFPQTKQKFQQEQEDRNRAIWEQAQFPGGKEKAYSLAADSFKNVSNIPASQFAINNVKQILAQDPKMFTGADANIRSSIERLGVVFGKPANPALSNTQAFRAMITPIIAQLRAAIVGPGSQSESEFKNLEGASGADITLERPAIEKILGSIERLNVIAATQHQKRLLANSGGDPNVRASLFGNYELPMEDIIPQRTINILRQRVQADPSKAATEIDNFDRDFHTPGLAAKILQRR